MQSAHTRGPRQGRRLLRTAMWASSADHPSVSSVPCAVLHQPAAGLVRAPSRMHYPPAKGGRTSRVSPGVSFARLGLA